MRRCKALCMGGLTEVHCNVVLIFSRFLTELLEILLFRELGREFPLWSAPGLEHAGEIVPHFLSATRGDSWNQHMFNTSWSGHPIAVSYLPKSKAC